VPSTASIRQPPVIKRDSHVSSASSVTNEPAPQPAAQSADDGLSSQIAAIVKRAPRSVAATEELHWLHSTKAFGQVRADRSNRRRSLPACRRFAYSVTFRAQGVQPNSFLRVFQTHC